MCRDEGVVWWEERRAPVVMFTEYGLPLTAPPPRFTTSSAAPATVAEHTTMQYPPPVQVTDVLSTPPSVAVMSAEATVHSSVPLQALPEESFTRT